MLTPVYPSPPILKLLLRISVTTLLLTVAIYAFRFPGHTLSASSVPARSTTMVAAATGLCPDRLKQQLGALQIQYATAITTEEKTALRARVLTRFAACNDDGLNDNLRGFLDSIRGETE